MCKCLTDSNSQTYPEWNHGREIEWTDSTSDPQWDSVCVCVHVLGNIGHGFSKLQRWNAAAMLHNLCNKNITHGTQPLTLQLFEILQ